MLYSVHRHIPLRTQYVPVILLSVTVVLYSTVLKYYLVYTVLRTLRLGTYLRIVNDTPKVWLSRTDGTLHVGGKLNCWVVVWLSISVLFQLISYVRSVLHVLAVLCSTSQISLVCTLRVFRGERNVMNLSLWCASEKIPIDHQKARRPPLPQRKSA